MATEGKNSKELTADEAVAQVDEDFERYFKELTERAKEKKKSGGEEDEDENKFSEQILEIASHPALLQEIDFSRPLHPATEALIAMQYEEQDPMGKAKAYKEDGNVEFQKKKYPLAIENYTVAITAKCPDRQLNAIIYTNRAAAQFHLGNYRSALHDCIFARKFKPNHMKAIVRGAQCCIETKRYKEVDMWCNAGFLLDPSHEKLMEMKFKADKLLKAQERDKRKEELKERKEHAKELNLITEIRDRGIQLAGLKVDEKGSKIDPTLLSNTEVGNSGNAKVHVDADNCLVWPVMFMYPEHTQTDFIEAFHENHRFIDHISHMFREEEVIPWDRDNKYIADNIQVYFEDREKETLYEVKSNSTLKRALKHDRYLVHDGLPCFILMVKDSKFQQHFLSKYEVKLATCK